MSSTKLSLAAEACLYGYPLVYNLEMMIERAAGLDIYFQHDSPGPERESNWLPAPAGRFRVAMRMYQPREAVLDGSYVLPPIRRVS
jgi:hypothetical protein